MSDLEVSPHDGQTERAVDKSVAAAPKTNGVAAKC
jgi:hypothetical protein